MPGSRMMGPGVAGLLVLLAAGCGVLSPEPAHDTSYYTLAPPASANALALQVGALDNESGAGIRMQYRNAVGGIVADEYRRWVADPGLLLANYLRSAFSDAKGAPQLEATIFRWEVDAVGEHCVLGIEWRLDDAAGDEISRARRTYTAPIAGGLTPDRIAAAFAACAGQWAGDIAKAIHP